MVPSRIKAFSTQQVFCEDPRTPVSVATETGPIVVQYSESKKGAHDVAISMADIGNRNSQAVTFK